jgi:hypothetical protein
MPAHRRIFPRPRRRIPTTCVLMALRAPCLPRSITGVARVLDVKLLRPLKRSNCRRAQGLGRQKAWDDSMAAPKHAMGRPRPGACLTEGRRFLLQAPRSAAEGRWSPVDSLAPPGKMAPASSKGTSPGAKIGARASGPVAGGGNWYNLPR